MTQRTLTGETQTALARALLTNHGVLTCSDMTALGLSRRSIERLQSSGALERVRRGVYATPSADPEVIRAAQLGGRVTCLSACRLHGLWVWRWPHPIHLSTKTGREVKGVVRHRSDTESQGPVVSMREAIRTAFRCAPPMEAMVAAESALCLGHLERAELEAMFIGQRDAGIRALIARLRTDSQSPPEVLARLTLEDAGHAVRTEVAVPGVGRVDGFADDVAYEIDGRAFHSGQDEFENDRRRWNALIGLGIPVVRIPARQVLEDPICVVEAVRKAQEGSRIAFDRGLAGNRSPLADLYGR